MTGKILTPDFKLSPHFTLAELTHSDWAIRHGVKIQVTEGNNVHSNLTLLCNSILEPLYSVYGNKIFITSGYRPPRVNTGIGGAKTSQHVFGQAADIQVKGVPPLQVAETIRKKGLPYDQLILEFGRWTHASFSTRHRRQALTAKMVRGKVTYLSGLVP